MADKRVTTSFRLSELERDILARWAARLGTTATGVIGLALRQLDTHGLLSVPPEQEAAHADEPEPDA